MKPVISKTYVKSKSDFKAALEQMEQSIFYAYDHQVFRNEQFDRAFGSLLNFLLDVVVSEDRSELLYTMFKDYFSVREYDSVEKFAYNTSFWGHINDANMVYISDWFTNHGCDLLETSSEFVQHLFQ